MNAAERAEINRENAAHSTGPVTAAGKQKSSLNGFKHGLTGQRMILQSHELEAYRALGAALHRDYAPQTELEKQLVQHIADCNMRLNRIAAIDANLLNIGLVENTRENVDHDDVTETVIAQTRAWVKQADSFEKLGRYEARISRQLLRYIQELDRIQALRTPPRTQAVRGENLPTQTNARGPRLVWSAGTAAAGHDSPRPLASSCTTPPDSPDPAFNRLPEAA